LRRLKGWGLGRGCALPSLGFCAKKYAILSKFWCFFPILLQKVGGLSPSPESGGPIPYPPLLRRLCRCEELSTHLSISVISKVLERVVLRRGYSSISRSMIFRVCSPRLSQVSLYRNCDCKSAIGYLDGTRPWRRSSIGPAGPVCCVRHGRSMHPIGTAPSVYHGIHFW